MIKYPCPMENVSMLFYENTAFTDGTANITYRELEMMVSSWERPFRNFRKNPEITADILNGSDITHGMDPATIGFFDKGFPKVMVKAEPSCEYISSLFAFIRAGITYIPYSARETAERIRKTAGKIQALVITDIRDFCSFVYHTLNTDTGDWEYENCKIHTVDLDFPCNMMLTSGSTALPKLVVHCLKAHIASALGSQVMLKLRPKDRYLLSLPLNHVGGQAVIFKTLMAGATMVAPRRDKKLTEQILDDGITVLSLVPTQLVRIINADPEILKKSRVRAILLGGAPIEPSLVDRVHQLYPDIALYGSYGSTEMASQICTCELKKNTPVTAGFALPDREIIIGKDNEILVRGETLCLGYFKNGAIKPVTDKDGYFHTGDIGEFLSEGLVIRGRKDNMFISGGENIHPEQIEAELLKDSRIEKAVVVPVPHDEWGKMAVVLVKTADDFRGTLQDLKQHALSVMSHVYVPKIWLDMPEIENTGLKLNRRKYIEYAEEFLSGGFKND